MNRKNLLDFGAIPYRTDQIMRLEPRCEGLKKLGWYPLIPLHNGLVQTINWFTNKTEIPLQTKLNTSMYFNLPERIKSLNN
jgi:dTDP-D-glucose 4,6-dehydratase